MTTFLGRKPISTWSIKSFIHLKSWCMDLASKSHRHEHSSFRSSMFFFCVFFFNTLCGEITEDVLIEYSQLLNWTSMSLLSWFLMHVKRSINWDERKKKKKHRPKAKFIWTSTRSDVCFVPCVFVVLYTWIKETCPQSVCEKVKVNNLHFWVAFGFMFYWESWEVHQSIFPVATEKQMMSLPGQILADINGAQFVFPRKVKGQQHHSTTSQQETCWTGFYCVVKV